MTWFSENGGAFGVDWLDQSNRRRRSSIGNHSLYPGGPIAGQQANLIILAPSREDIRRE